MYTQSSIDRIREQDIVQIIGSFIKLKKEGANYKANSPFKEEKTPSFVVSPSKQIFKCFASGIGGDAIRFIQEYNKASFLEAVKTIAEKSNIYLETENQSPDQVNALHKKNEIIQLNTKAAKRYAKQLNELKPTHWAKKILKEREYSEAVIIEFQLGFTPGNIVNKATIELAKFSVAVEAGLCNTAQNGTSYDCFTQRLIFPIHNQNGQVIGFGGRRSNSKEDSKYPKYINTKETSAYNKSAELYGLSQAKRSIVAKKAAILVEGYTDVLSLHQKECTHAIATCGTSLTKLHLLKLAKYCSHLIIFRDGDEAGRAAAFKEVDLILNQNLQVSICISPNGEDPDSLCRSQENIEQYIKENTQDGLIWKVSEIYKNALDSVYDRANCLRETIKILALVKDEATQNEYCKTLALANKNITKRDLIQGLKEFKTQQAKKVLVQIENVKPDNDGFLNLPKGADRNQFAEDGFVLVNNSYYFQTKEGFFKGTNHIITPLFHIYGRNENKRLCEITNSSGQSRLIDFDSKDFINFGRIQERLIEEGVFLWMPQAQVLHFKMVAQRVLSKFIMAHELTTLGWQVERFFAFANGAYYKNEFQEVNKYGIIKLEKETIEVENDEVANIKHFYSPAYSDIYKNSREGDDPYENDRSFIYKTAPISLNKWMAQMCNSGKSKFGDSIANFFTYKLKPFDLNTGTKVGFYRRIARIKNVPVLLEEFHDAIDLVMFQSLKGAYDGRGREKGTMTTDNRTNISKVNSSCIIAGQYLSARDDNSLTSRSIVEHFIKPIPDYSIEQVKQYNVLKEWEEQGLSSLVLDIVKYRELFEQNFHAAFAENIKKFKKELLKFDYQERMLNNYTAIYTPIQLLYSCFKFPFTLNDFFEQCKNGIIDNSDLIIESEGIAKFWEILEHLLKKGIIKKGVDYSIDKQKEVTINPGKGIVSKHINKECKALLYIRLSSIHQEYHLEASKRKDMDVIGMHTLINYFKSKRYFISPISKKRFNGSPTSCYLFDYEFMRAKNILNLDIDGSFQPFEQAEPIKAEAKEDFPF